jgi:hypothetical protein
MNPPTWAKNAMPPPFALALNSPDSTDSACLDASAPRRQRPWPPRFISFRTESSLDDYSIMTDN